MDIIWIGVAAFIGGIVSSLLGWLESQSPFDPRKFAASLVRALVAGVAFAVAFQYSNGLSPIDIGFALLGGAGFDAVGNRIGGIARKS